MRKKSGPPPIVIDPMRAESVAAMGGTNKEIAAALGVSEGTLFNVRKRDPALDAALQSGKDKADLRVVGSLYKKATEDGDTTAMIFWLKNRQPDRWRDRQQHDFSGEIKGKVEITVVTAVPRPPNEPGK
jgi:hypothetical protein